MSYGDCKRCEEPLVNGEGLCDTCATTVPAKVWAVVRVVEIEGVSVDSLARIFSTEARAVAWVQRQKDEASYVVDDYEMDEPERWVTPKEIVDREDLAKRYATLAPSAAEGKR